MMARKWWRFWNPLESGLVGGLIFGTLLSIPFVLGMWALVR